MAESGTPLVVMRGARLGYGGRAVLDGVDLAISAGEFWFLLGANGSGKTTLLRAILGLIEPLAGEVRRDPRHASLGRIGFVPQRCEISHALPTTVREFVSLGAIGAHRARVHAAADLAWALDRAGLAGLADRDYGALSGGQRQRALVARALVRRPELLLLDEPTEGLDGASEEVFHRTLEDLHARGETTPVFVTHRLAPARRFATHLAWVADGRVVAGPRDAILRGRDPAELLGMTGS